MPKQRFFFAAPAGADRAGFRDTMLRDHAPAILRAAPALRAASVCLVNATPVVPPWQRANEPPAPSEPPFDAVLDLWGDDAALAAAAQAIPLPQLAARVIEIIEKDELPRPVGRVPGVKFLSLMTFHDDLPERAARRLWAHHAPLALRVHVGMARYVRDWVTALDPMPAASFHGIAELHFPTVEAMMTRWFDSDAGRAAILHDVGHFLARATRLYTTEHVLK
jgi:hypothetical protein